MKKHKPPATTADLDDYYIEVTIIVALLHAAGGELVIEPESWNWACQQLGIVGFERVGQGDHGMLLRIVDADARPVRP